MLGVSGKCCGGRTVEVDSRRLFLELTEEMRSELRVQDEVDNDELFCGRAEVSNGALVLVCSVVVVVVVVVCVGFSGFTMHSSVGLDHLLFPIHLMRLEVPALLTYPSMHL